ncbi:hypothetical protein KA005_55160, partial [bacterium]|nr:hypothetical protein [bacterium]
PQAVADQVDCDVRLFQLLPEFCTKQSCSDQAPDVFLSVDRVFRPCYWLACFAYSQGVKAIYRPGPARLLYIFIIIDSCKKFFS